MEHFKSISLGTSMVKHISHCNLAFAPFQSMKLIKLIRPSIFIERKNPLMLVLFTFIWYDNMGSKMETTCKIFKVFQYVYCLKIRVQEKQFFSDCFWCNGNGSRSLSMFHLNGNINEQITFTRKIYILHKT